jgi:hypothetical protein
MHNLVKQELQAQSEYDHSTQIGVAAYKGYSLRRDWEVVPGNWTMQIWYGTASLRSKHYACEAMTRRNLRLHWLSA